MLINSFLKETNMSTANIASTIIVVTSTDSEFSIPGYLAPETIKTVYASQIPGISSMDYTASTETRGGQQVSVVTFRPRTGTKG